MMEGTASRTEARNGMDLDTGAGGGAEELRAAVAAVRERGRTQVLIIGGGINGIATFRDLALQGVDVLLVERGDFASGASAASSHMIHGGIRYLENGEFRLVHESVRERNDLLKTAPHYVRPLPTTIPITRTFSGLLAAPLRFLAHRQGRPQERGALLIRTGLAIYDLFSRDGGAVPRHRFRGRRRTRRELPDLSPRFRYTATYFDASLRNPERLALDVLRDGEAAHPGAIALNFVEATGLGPGGVRLHDRESGEELTVAAEIVVNASGPWTDLTNAALGAPTAFLGGTKGSHIVLDHPELLRATGGREIFFEHEDGRIVLIYPLKGRVLVGTTDIDADPREPARATSEEVEYFFDLIAHVFPHIVVLPAHIVFRYSGIRPLPRHDGTAPGFVSRDYRIERRAEPGAPPVLSLVGGKWTTFRALGETLADRVLGELGLPRRVSTRGLPIGGGRDYPRPVSRLAAWLRDHDLDSARGRMLVARYGTRALAVRAFLAEADDRPILGDALSARELEWMVRHEHVRHVADVVLRRTSLAFVGAIDADGVTAIAEALAPHLGWNASRTREEAERCLTVLREEHGLAL